jgi:hypothetical protein
VGGVLGGGEFARLDTDALILVARGERSLAGQENGNINSLFNL